MFNNASQPVIELKGITKYFNRIISANPTLKQKFVGMFNNRAQAHKDNFTAVNNVSFSLNQGESLALLGHNGCGKSTILRIIAGILQPTSGEIMTRGKISPLIEVGAGFHPELSGYENIFLNASLLGMSKAQTLLKLDEIIAFSELENFIHAPVKTYSSGMYTRLGFAVAVFADPQILLADEILSVGDANFKKKCLHKIQAMQKEGMTLVLVTHSLDQAKTFCNRYIKIESGRMIEEGSCSTLTETKL